MSRVGKSAIAIPEKVQFEIKGTLLTVKGPLGELTYDMRSDVEIVKEENELVVKNKNEATGKYWGTTRAVIASLFE